MKKVLKFEITDKLSFHVDYDKQTVDMTCETKDGRSLHILAGYQILDHIHTEIQRHLNKD